MRKIAIAALVMILLVGGAIGVMKQLEKGPFASAEAETSAAETAAAETNGPPRFLDMQPLSVPIFAEDSVAATIHLQVKLETVGLENEALLTRLMPRLSDAFLRELYGYLPRLLRREGTLDLPAVKERLQMVGDRIAGPGVIDGVLIQAISENPGT